MASSRFVARKNLIGLLKAYQVYMEQIRQREVQPWRLVILGDGEERENLEEFISGYQIDGVTLAGFRQIEELPIYYGLANAFIHPALQEQWGLVVNEAMACGLPVFVSEKCGCAYDLIHPGENGYTFDPGSISQISDLMLQATIGELDLKLWAKLAKRS
ncbi:MAG: glycosyltransferase family 4 protein [Chloroflexi bacterium]|nr:glycosyltransferase family 4 protein [Chloroflexota bacterium]